MSVSWAIQPETYKKQVKRSLMLYRASFSHVFFLSLLLSVIVFLPRLLALLVGDDIFLTLPPLNPQRLWLLLIDLSALFVFTALLWRIRCVINDSHDTLLDDVKIAIKKIPLIVVAAIIQSVLFSIVTITTMIYFYYIKQHDMASYANHLIVIPMFVFLFHFMIIIYIFFLFIFYLPLILTENQSILSAIKKSAELVWGNWWRTFFLQITPWMMYFVVLVMLKSYLPIHIYFFPTEPATFMTILFHILLFALFIPVVGSTLLVQLRDLELRKAV